MAVNPQASLQAFQKRLEAEYNELKGFQKEIGKLNQQRSQFTSQLNENEMVLKEINILEPEADVFKLIGPVMIKQDVPDVRGNVEKRLEFIRKELKRVEDSLSEMEKKGDEKRKSVQGMQEVLQRHAQQMAMKAGQQGVAAQ